MGTSAQLKHQRIVPLDISDYYDHFMSLLDSCLGRQPMPDLLRQAVIRAPRHKFVHKFSVSAAGRAYDCDLEQEACLSLIYRDAVLWHVSASGEKLLSTNSKPTFILSLLDRLDLKPGQRILEVGSGSGWLTAIMANMVGPSGHVTGIELLKELADKSREDLLALGLNHAVILCQEDLEGISKHGPYDRVLASASVWNAGMEWFDLLVEGGRMLLPIELRGSARCHVGIFQKQGANLIGRYQIGGGFIPLVGASQDRSDEYKIVSSLPAWNTLSKSLIASTPFWLGSDSQGCFGAAAYSFRAFLGRTQETFAVLDVSPDLGTFFSAVPFGLVAASGDSVALCAPERLLAYGNVAARDRLSSAYADWVRLRMPGITAFQLTLSLSDPDSVLAKDTHWVERRGQTRFIWTLSEAMDPTCSV